MDDFSTNMLKKELLEAYTKYKGELERAHEALAIDSFTEGLGVEERKLYDLIGNQLKEARVFALHLVIPPKTQLTLVSNK